MCRCEDPLADILNQRYSTVREQLEAIRKRKALLESKGVSIPSKRPSSPASLYLSPAQKLRLQQHIQQVRKCYQCRFCYMIFDIRYVQYILKLEIMPLSLIVFSDFLCQLALFTKLLDIILKSVLVTFSVVEHQ